MARLKLINPSQYRSAERIGAEFENLTRYLNSAELGNRTLGELLGVLFDPQTGDFNGPIEMRLDTGAGLQWRIGEYPREDGGWVTIASTEDLRGSPGQSLGIISEPVMYGREDFVADGIAATYSYYFTADDDVIVYKNGYLQPRNTYTTNLGQQSVTMQSPPAQDDEITLFRLRMNPLSNFRRVTMVTTPGQAVFSLVHDFGEEIAVYMNGALLREGGAFDYVLNATTNTLSLTTPAPSGGILIDVLIFNNAGFKAGGLLTEAAYTTNGFIRWDKIAVDNGDIAQAKINGLINALDGVTRITVDSIAPVSPDTGELWVDLSESPAVLNFYTGFAWVPASPNIDIPEFSGTVARQFLQVNAGGTALQWASPDYSTLVSTSQKGVANGVAALDSTGRVPIAQLPGAFSLESLFLRTASAANTDYVIKRIFRQKVNIDAIVLKTASGTCSVQVLVDGTPVGAVHPVTSTLTEEVLVSPIEVDASTTSKLIGFRVTSNASAATLDVTLALSGLTA
jgi:hypothetical protein